MAFLQRGVWHDISFLALTDYDLAHSFLVNDCEVIGMIHAEMRPISREISAKNGAHIVVKITIFCSFSDGCNSRKKFLKDISKLTIA